MSASLALLAAVDSAGPAGAIDFCSTRALALTAEAVAPLEGVAINGTTARVRNPAKAPDSPEAEALPPRVATALAQRYPQDRATSSAPGDFRGLSRVRIARSALEAGAP